jgi:hypothetical protein
MLLAMVMLNIASIANASCLLDDPDHTHVADLEHASDIQDLDQDNNCDCCHGACSHTTFMITTNKMAYQTDRHTLFFSRDGTDYPSHFQYPPSRPPKA